MKYNILYSIIILNNYTETVQLNKSLKSEVTNMASFILECPACGAKLTIPDAVEDGIGRHELGDDDPDAVQAMKSRTIRIELGDL